MNMASLKLVATELYNPVLNPRAPEDAVEWSRIYSEGTNRLRGRVIELEESIRLAERDMAERPAGAIRQLQDGMKKGQTIAAQMVEHIEKWQKVIDAYSDSGAVIPTKPVQHQLVTTLRRDIRKSLAMV